MLFRSGQMLNWLNLVQKPNVALATAERQLGEYGYRTLSDTHSKANDVRTLHVRGGFPDILRFLGEMRPPRLLEIFSEETLAGQIRTMERVRVEHIEPLGPQEVVTIGTDTHTFVAEGFACHNSFVAFHMEDGSLVICEGRGLDLTGAHTHAHNTRGIATAGEGNFQIGQTVTPYIDHWSRWWGWLRHDEGMENLGSARPTVGPNVGAIAFGHRDFIATGCPGDNLYAIIPQLTFKEAPEPPEEDDMPKDLLSHKGNGRSYVLDGPYKIWLNPGWLASLKAADYAYLDLTDKEIDGIPERPPLVLEERKK